MKMFIRICLFGLFALPVSCFGQDPLSDMKELGRLYASASSLSMSISVSTDVPGEQNSQLAFKGWMKKSGNNLMSYISGKTILSNANCQLMLLEQNKTIIYGDALPASYQDELAKLGLNDSAFYANRTMKYLPATGGRKKIEVLFDKASHAPYEKMEVTYVPGQRLEEIVYYNARTDEKAPVSKTVIRYEDVKINTPIPLSEFSETLFVTRKKDVFQPVVKYNGYKVVDQRRTQTKKK